MSGEPEQVPVDGTGRRIALVAARWHPEVTGALLAGAVEEALACGVADEDVERVRVAGAVELPIVADALARSRRVDAIVCLGVVVRGGTPHFDYVCRAVTDGCTRVALDHGVPVGFGVLTVDTLADALARKDKGREAVRAVLETVAVLDEVRGGVRGHTGTGFATRPGR